MKLALFDLDNTLLDGDSDFEWAQFLIGKGVLDREVHEATNLEFFEQYKAGTLDIHAFLDFQLAPLARHSRTELDAWLESLGLWLGGFEQSWFYSDSHNDLPLLEKVTHPVAVDADATLTHVATERDWLRISLRD